MLGDGLDAQGDIVGMLLLMGREVVVWGPFGDKYMLRREGENGTVGDECWLRVCGGVG